MKNKVFNVSKADLDDNLVHVVDTYLDVTVTSPINNSDTRRNFPKQGFFKRLFRNGK